MQRSASSFTLQSASVRQAHWFTPLTHWPLALQMSPLVHKLPSSQAKNVGPWVQPTFALQLSLVQTFLSSQSTGLVPTQAPPKHVELPVQTVPSSQGAPWALAVLTHNPLFGWQILSLHVSVAAQMTVLLGLGTQLPP